MNNKLNNFNFLNFRNVSLFLGSIIFLLISFLIILSQRNNSIDFVSYSNTYIILASILIFILFLSLSNLVVPIILRVRRKKISTLNSKFTLYFIMIALTPAFILGILGTILINMGINDWFNSKINNVINNSVYVAESYLEEHKETIKGDVYAMSNDLNDSRNVFINNLSKFTLGLKTQALVRSLPEAYILDDTGKVIINAFDSKLVNNPPKIAFQKADIGEMTIMSSTQVNKVYALVKLNNYVGLYLFAGRSMDANVISAVNDTRSAKNEYIFLEESRNQISLVFILIYFIITLALILFSTIIGLKLAKKIVKPISSIITASNNISNGSYDNMIEKNNDYIELNRLAESFNKMSNDLKKQRNQIIIAKKHETWSDIARRIAHEIKNPLTPIQLSSERLEKKLENLDKNNEVFDCIKTIRRQVNEIGLLVDEFSNFARLPNPNFNPCDIIKIVDECIFDYQANYNNINFIKDYEFTNFELNIDKSQMIRVFQNLLKNSIESIEENKVSQGEIICRINKDHNVLKISILDNGTGIKFVTDELIKPYFTTKKRFGGSGLGLAIVEKILFDHNAEFIIENRSDGVKGAITSIKFE